MTYEALAGEIKSLLREGPSSRPSKAVRRGVEGHAREGHWVASGAEPRFPKLDSAANPRRQDHLVGASGRAETSDGDGRRHKRPATVDKAQDAVTPHHDPLESEPTAGIKPGRRTALEGRTQPARIADGPRFVRCCQAHPTVEAIEGPGEVLWCPLYRHDVRSWLIRDLVTGRIVGRSHWLNGGNLDAGAFEPSEPSPEPPRCAAHDVPLRPRADRYGSRCPACKRAGIQRARRQRERSATA